MRRLRGIALVGVAILQHVLGALTVGRHIVRRAQGHALGRATPRLRSRAMHREGAGAAAGRLRLGEDVGDVEVRVDLDEARDVVCGGGSWWLFLPWLRRRKLVAVLAVAAAAEVRGEGVGTSRQLVAAVPRGSRAVVGEGVGEGVGTRGWMPPRQLVATVPRWSRGVDGEGVAEG